MKSNKLLLLLVIVSSLLAWNCKDASEAVKTPVKAIKVEPEIFHLTVNGTQQITAEPDPLDADPEEKPFKWESSNAGIATVSASGLVRGVSAGSAEITVRAQVSSNVEKKIPVTVSSINIPLTAIVVSPETVTLNVNETRQIRATPEPSNATDVSFSWSSDNSNVATVSSASGVVTGKNKGTATVTVKSGNIEKKIPVAVVQPFTIYIGSIAYRVDTLDYREIAPGVKWLKFNMPEYVNGFGTPGKGLVSNIIEVDLSVEGNRLEVCAASQATLYNVERPTAMYARKNAAYSASGRKVVAAINGDFYLLSSSNTTGYAYINNRPLGMEVENGRIVQTPFSWNNGFVLSDNRLPSHGTVTYSGTVDAAGQTFPLAEINGFAGAGELVLFNNLSNSYPTDSAFAWSPYTSMMVSLSYPEGGWRVNERMEFTVTQIEHDIEGKDFNGESAILAGNSFGDPNRSLGLGNNPETPHAMTVSDQGAYFDTQTTGDDPYVYTTTLTSSISGAATASFSFEYQSATSIPDFQIFYGVPWASADASTAPNLQLSNTGIDAGNESKWQTFTLDMKPAILNHNWGKNGHALRLDIGGKSGYHVLIRNMKLTADYSDDDDDSRTFLSKLRQADKIGITMNVKLDGRTLTDKHLNVVGYHSVILQQGIPVNNWNEAHPRTATGYSQDGKKVYLLVVDGRQANYSVGVATNHLAAILKAFGAYSAVNLDGGGSSCMVVEGQIKNKPSDGSERAVANGIIVTVNK
ncbi:MAG: phosphodiester glycosidase family protein [Bacteroidales bacterium]|jgi:hypothetical protein|nr:phosphodiester glycosidase family protein [Bacteroidales bacterium]